MKETGFKIAAFCAKNPHATIAEIGKACGVSSGSAYYWIKKLEIPVARGPGRPGISDEYSKVKGRSVRYYLRKKRLGLCPRGGCSNSPMKMRDGTLAVYCKEHSR